MSQASLPAANVLGLMGEIRVCSILVRGVDQKTIQRPTERARFNGRSRPQEIKAS
jgi:hypothetical protein